MLFLPGTVERQIDHSLAQLRITESASGRRLRQDAQFSHTRQRVDFQHNGVSIGPNHHINAGKIAATDGVERAHGGVLNARGLCLIKRGRAKMFGRAGSVFVL